MYYVAMLYKNGREYRRSNKNGQSRETGNIGYTTRKQKNKNKNTTRGDSISTNDKYIWKTDLTSTGQIRDHKTTITGSGHLKIYDESNEEEPEGSCIGKPT